MLKIDSEHFTYDLHLFNIQQIGSVYTFAYMCVYSINKMLPRIHVVTKGLRCVDPFAILL